MLQRIFQLLDTNNVVFGLTVALMTATVAAVSAYDFLRKRRRKKENKNLKRKEEQKRRNKM